MHPMKSTSAPLLAVLLPLGWHAQTAPTLQTHDFNTGQPHSFTSDGSRATIVAGGADIWQAADSFVFNYLAVTNDFDFRLRVLSVEDADGGGFARSGLMVRDALTAGSRHMMVPVNANNTAQTIYRTRAGDNALDNGTVIPAFGSNSWVRLVRHGNVFANFMSANGTNWTPIYQFDGAREGDGAFTNAVMYLGIATSSHDAGKTTTAVVSDLGVTPSAARLGPPAATAEPAPDVPQSFVEVTTGVPVFYRWQANDVNITDVTNATSAASGAAHYSAQLCEIERGAPLVFSVVAGGEQPIRYSAKDLPAGLSLDPKRGLITGALKTSGEFTFSVLAKNSAGKAETKIKLVTGTRVAMTPPMGWNSYDAWGTSITEAETLANAAAMKKLLRAHGWQYVVIDARWYDSVSSFDDRDFNQERGGAKLFADEFGRMLPATNRFPSAIGGKGFQPLADKIHALDLKFGFHMMRGIPRQAVFARTPIEGSTFTAADAANTNSICGWCPDMFGVRDNEAGQAWYDSMFRLYAAWGLDFIKVDDLSVPYSAGEIEMIRKAIDKCGHPIVFSTSPGPTDVAHAAHIAANANLWRISGDFWDRWKDLNHAFDLVSTWQGKGGPGHWPDADMIPFGHLGIKCTIAGKERQTRFTRDEQRTLMSLWSLVPSPLMLGANLTDLDQPTLALLNNDEVIALNQDPLGQPARRVTAAGTSPEIWTRQLASGALAVGIFNRSANPLTATVSWRDHGFVVPPNVRDLWTHKVLPGQENFTSQLPPHGCVLLQVTATVNAEPMAGGKFKPTWESLKQYQVPEWFRDAKFGIWAHWGPQCQPEDGDWYARGMYQTGGWQYQFHTNHYGSPKDFGFKDVIHSWHAENWDPEKLVELYQRAGAQYFFALANHHDNFDLWDSTYQPWNSVAIGPQKDLIGGWAAAARKNGLRFGVSVHAAHAWTWYEPAQDYDGKLTKAGGKGQWWEGLDPQDLYAQNHAPAKEYRNPGKIHSQWNWGNGANLPDQAYCEKFYNRTMDLINKYQPDLIYFDDTALPLWPVSDAGLKIAAHFYNSNNKWHGANDDGVLFGKILDADQQQCMAWDIERGVNPTILPHPWQTDTCIGGWHYDRGLYDHNDYKSTKTVIQMLADIVSKNGNLLLNIPVRGDGTIDEKELKVVEGIADWMDVNKECIFVTRPWKTFGEGPASAGAALSAQGFNEGKGKPFTFEDVRFTQSKDGQTLYAIVLGAPTNGVSIPSLGKNAKLLDQQISQIQLLGGKEKLQWQQTGDALEISQPKTIQNDFANVFKISLRAK